MSVAASIASNAMELLVSSDGSGAVGMVGGSTATTPVTDRIKAVMQSPLWAVMSGDEAEEHFDDETEDNIREHSSKHVNSIKWDTGNTGEALGSEANQMHAPKLVRPYMRLSGEDDELLKSLARTHEQIVMALQSIGVLRSDSAIEGSNGGNNQQRVCTAGEGGWSDGRDEDTYRDCLNPQGMDGPVPTTTATTIAGGGGTSEDIDQAPQSSQSSVVRMPVSSSQTVNLHVGESGTAEFSGNEKQSRLAPYEEPPPLPKDEQQHPEPRSPDDLHKSQPSHEPNNHHKHNHANDPRHRQSTREPPKSTRNQRTRS